MENTSLSINLVKKKEIDSFDNFLNWALSIGRLIVIATQIIAISALIYRFSLDQRLVSLHDEIGLQQKQLSFLRKDEENFRNLQDRLDLASNFSQEGTKVYRIFQDIVSFTPEDLKYDDMTLRRNQTTIDLSVASIPTLTDFVNSLKSYSKTRSVSIDNIVNNPDTGLSVAITALFK